jgi:tripeptidyl-peptidase-1
MFFSKLSLYAIGVAGSHALPSVVRSEYAVKERHLPPISWVEKGPAPKDQTIHLQIGLKQGNEGLVEKHLTETSDPNHARYGQHLTTAEISDMIRPSDETLDLVQAWLEEHDIRDYFHNPSKDWIHVVVTTEKAEQLLRTKYSTYVNWDGASVSRTPEWSLPLHLHEHIDVVQPTNSFFRAAPQIYKPLLDNTVSVDQWWQESGAAQYSEDSADASISKLCNISFTTVKCVRALYGTLDYKVQSADKNGMYCTGLSVHGGVIGALHMANVLTISITC